MTRRYIWTEAEVSELIAINAAGDTAREAAARFGITVQQVFTKSHALCISWMNGYRNKAQNRFWTAAELGELIAINAAGGTPREAAARLGFTIQQIHAKSAPLGITWRKRAARSTIVDRVGLQRPQDRPPPAPAPATRVCLRCQKSFTPGWRTNYLCRPCTVLNKHVIEEDDYPVAASR